MGQCVICGKETDELFLSRIEGADIEVCKNCAKLGTIINSSETPVNNNYSNFSNNTNNDFSSSEVVSVLVENYGKLVKSARENKNWKQEDLAKKLAIKESLLHNIESGHFEPTEVIIHKLEKFLHIKLMITMENKKTSIKKFEDENDSPMTLGDMIKKKLKK